MSNGSTPSLRSSVPGGDAVGGAAYRPRLLDLFSGIGGFSLGLERAGFETAAFCEIDPFCRRVLARHWPKVHQYDDVQALTAERLAADGLAVDVICGGFPCQDLSNGGRRAGLSGKRSGLWREFARLIEEVRPQAVIIENVTALRRRGLDQVLRFFAEIRYDAEWHCVPGAAIGSPDIRDRLWVIAYPQYPDAHGQRPYPAEVHLEGGAELFHQQDRVAGPVLSALPGRHEGLGPGTGGRWPAEPGIRRVADRTAERVHRTRVIGYAVKPDMAEIIGRALMEFLQPAASRLERAA